LDLTPPVPYHFAFLPRPPLALSHEHPHRLAGLLIRATDTGAFRDAGTGRGDCFDLVWIDVEARDDDHVLLAVDDLEEPPLVEHADVAGAEIAIGCKRSRIGLGLLPVTLHHLRAFGADFATLARRR